MTARTIKKGKHGFHVVINEVTEELRTNDHTKMGDVVDKQGQFSVILSFIDNDISLPFDFSKPLVIQDHEGKPLHLFFGPEEPNFLDSVVDATTLEVLDSFSVDVTSGFWYLIKGRQPKLH